jgi:hypothetical protein
MTGALAKRIIYITGLPRAGSTLLCQLLGQHPAVYSTGHSSPLCHALERLRYQLSDDPFLLAQLDVDLELTHRRLLNAYRGFIEGWFAETELRWVVDKNRGWLNLIETVQLLDPDFKMLVCVRELSQIYGSIEAQHQKTLLLDFVDHLAGYSRYARAESGAGALRSAEAQRAPARKRQPLPLQVPACHPQPAHPAAAAPRAAAHLGGDPQPVRLVLSAALPGLGRSVEGA